ncbi:MAG: signal peptidase I [Parachlamydiaceae bacterium]|nr:signal peptidase I [Parachlamydiaceae bacterium]
MIFNRLFSLRKSRHVLQNSYTSYQKKGSKLSPELRQSLENQLLQLEKSLDNNDRTAADAQARTLETFCHTHFKKTFFDFGFELAFALVLALAVATVIRSMWFEPYEIPTGSMRPTFREQDHLTVSKLTFGINIPLETKHFYFDPNSVQRSSIGIFSGANIPFIDSDTTYFWVIPYKKRYIKRNIAKPGDSVYFYGGKVYAVDSEGHLITDLLEAPWMKHLEHVPFLSFDGRPSMSKNNEILFNQMNMPVGRLSLSSNGSALVGEVFNGKEWIKDLPDAQKSPHDQIQTYSDLWGMRNYAMARLLTKAQLDTESLAQIKDQEEAPLYLELRHNPNLVYPKPRIQQGTRGLAVMLTPYTTIIPLQQHHLDALMNQMYTARFVVKEGLIARYSVEGTHLSPNNPRITGVPDGTYEFYFGKAEKIGWAGVASTVPQNSPLYSHDPLNIQKWFNLGIELDTAFSPSKDRIGPFPRRYAYFRNGDLYLLGAPILTKDDPTLVSFEKDELSRQEQSSTTRPYIAFKDYGPPLKADGTPDINFIRTFGVHIPEKNYLMLGDNHAMSSDSREFGFVPEDNLQGAPSLIFWPPGERLGTPAQKPYPIFTFPRLLIWLLASIIALIWYWFHLRHMNRRIVF